jgi:two-component system, response regulator
VTETLRLVHINNGKVYTMSTGMSCDAILLAEDDVDDRMMILRALRDAGATDTVRAVGDGIELMDYLHRRGDFGEEPSTPRLILLDLNMPRKSGREALHEIKKDPALRSIPVVILTTSTSPVDIRESYNAGANAYVTKPASYTELAELALLLMGFWCKAVRFPHLE